MYEDQLICSRQQCLQRSVCISKFCGHVMWQKMKVLLLDRVRCQYIEFWVRNVVQHGKIDLPKRFITSYIINEFKKVISF